MATRRDHLDAHVAARARMVAALTRPTATAADDTPRPLRAVVPGVLVAALLLTVFGVYGLVRPGMSAGWKDGSKLIVGRGSASRYVYLNGVLHPVLNVASARLLLDPDRFGVATVGERTLDTVPLGPTLGIAQAPDRLPAPTELRRGTFWTVCDAPAPLDGTASQGERGAQASRHTSVFVGPRPQGRLAAHEALLVRARPSTGAADTYLVQDGRRYPVADAAVLSQLGLDAVRPQPVDDAWLATVPQGPPLLPPVVDSYGRPTPPTLGLPRPFNRVGLVLRTDRATSRGSERDFYVVTVDGVHPVSEFTAQLVLAHPGARRGPYRGASEVTAVPFPVTDLARAIRRGAEFAANNGWPRTAPIVVNRPDPRDPGSARTVVCNTFTGRFNGDLPQTYQSAATVLPTAVGNSTAAGGARQAYVPPGGGALFREVTGAPTDATGPLYLLTDTGLRYSVPQDSAGPSAGPGAKRRREGAGEAQARLGYREVRPTPVPRAWSDLLDRGPVLAPEQATLPQGY